MQNFNISATTCPPLTFSVEAGVERLYISISYSDSTATNFSVVYTINGDSMTMTSEKRNFFLLVGSSMQTVDITITSQDVCGSSSMQQAATCKEYIGSYYESMIVFRPSFE